MLHGQVYFLNISRGLRFPETTLNGAEMQLFRLPAFNGSKKVPGKDRFPTTFEEAGSRLIYTAVYVMLLFVPRYVVSC